VRPVARNSNTRDIRSVTRRNDTPNNSNALCAEAPRDLIRRNLAQTMSSNTRAGNNSNIRQRSIFALAKLEKYVEYVIPRLRRLLGFYMERPFRKLRFTRFMFSEHQLTEICKQFEKGAIIAFDN
jgi:hypothetical protein